MIVGRLSEKKTNKETNEDFYNLPMNIPFLKETEFYVAENKNKTKDTHPSLVMFYKGEKAGSIWVKEMPGSNETYYSGIVFCLGMPFNQLNFAMFQAKDKDKKIKKDKNGNSIWIATISDGKPRDNSTDNAPEHEEGETF